MSQFDITGRVAVVTGANRGIGFGIAQALARAGAIVVVSARTAGANADAVKQIEAEGGRALAIEADMHDETACRALCEKAAERLGRLDILVNNAGVANRKPPQDHTSAEWRKVIDINLSAPFWCAQAAYPAMQRGGGGKIINRSMLSIFATAYAVAYGASKGGIVQMTKSLACAWAKDNIQVNAILPGWIDTEFTRTGRKEVPGLHERVLARTPAGRWGKPEDLAGVAVFLASAASDFVTGATIAVDGGFSAQG
jgi:2-dehydro-3-deoxy-D-gluconate 5-dehydrogenase